MNDKTIKTIIVFDGFCKLCNRSIRFVHARDRDKCFRYVPFDSDAGRVICERFSLDPEALDSFLVIDRSGIFEQSAAWFRVLRQLRFPWSWLGALMSWIPPPISDFFYRIIGSNRYRWFGRSAVCEWPASNEDDVVSVKEIEAALANIDAKR